MLESDVHSCACTEVWMTESPTVRAHVLALVRLQLLKIRHHKYAVRVVEHSSCRYEAQTQESKGVTMSLKQYLRYSCGNPLHKDEKDPKCFCLDNMPTTLARPLA